MSEAATHFKLGDLALCLAELQNDVRRDPANGAHRVFLAQLLMVLGQWERALGQLVVLESMDGSYLPMVRTYQCAIQCERMRVEVFAGARAPLILGEPEPWLAALIQANKLLSQAALDAAAKLRDAALDAAEDRSGSMNGASFQWLADMDSRLGPVFELLVDGMYYWVPMSRVQRLTAEVPQDIRDLVWLPVQVLWTTGATSVALMPTRYPGTELLDNASLRLSRSTHWRDVGTDTFLGDGQRVFGTDSSEFGVLDLRTLEFAS